MRKKIKYKGITITTVDGKPIYMRKRGSFQMYIGATFHGSLERLKKYNGGIIPKKERITVTELKQVIVNSELDKARCWF